MNVPINMHTYNKIGKTKNITYTFGKNRANSKDGLILADFTRHPKGRDRVNNFTEATCAWVNLKTKEIVWDEEVEDLIDKAYIRNFVIMML